MLFVSLVFQCQSLTMKNKLLWSFFSLILCLTFYNQVQREVRCNHSDNFQLKTGTSDNLRSDTIDVINYQILLDFRNASAQQISGNCQVKFQSLQNNVSTLNLDLLKLSIDSIKQQNQILNYSYNDTLIVIELATTLNQNELDSVTVYYQGHPQGDPSNWGGFYFQGNYSYNLGVGFGADPHNYGRIWHPCFDNFVERATYDITLIVPSGFNGYANGLIVSETDFGTHKERSWRLNQDIPTYLACVAVSNYTHVDLTFNSSLTGSDIPMYLIAAPTDTNNMKTSFANLPNAMNAFENQYGPYLWDKVGFHLVPFSSGAMEHATSIAYPRATSDGSLTYETLMAHELAHHWWGNLVTCRTDGDMWINEGMASYSERIFLEYVYGYSNYLSDIKNNHKDVLLNAHIRDNGYYAISGVPHEITYGDHSYNKGADVAHNLRTYMGDTEFFSGLQSFLNDNMFSDVDALDFRDHLNTNTNANVTDFFDDWIFNPGFPGFIIDSSIVSNNGNNYTAQVHIHQKLKGTTDLFSNVPMEITFIGSDFQDTTFSFVCSNEFTVESFNLLFEPEIAYLNGNDKLSMAVTGENKMIKTTGTRDLNYPMFRYFVSNTVDSSLVRVEHYWVAPDEFKEPENEFAYYLSKERFWKVDGIWADGFTATGRVFFNGKTGTGAELDIQLTSMPGFHEDSICLFYRQNSSTNWERVQNVTMSNLGSKTDGYGYIDFPELMKGEYTFGWRKSPLAVDDIEEKVSKIFPNPVSQWLTIETNFSFGSSVRFEIYNTLGEIVYSKPYYANQINVSEFPSGIYFLKVIEEGLEIQTIKFIKE